MAKAMLHLGNIMRHDKPDQVSTESALAEASYRLAAERWKLWQRSPQPSPLTTITDARLQPPLPMPEDDGVGESRSAMTDRDWSQCIFCGLSLPRPRRGDDRWNFMLLQKCTAFLGPETEDLPLACSLPLDHQVTLPVCGYCVKDCDGFLRAQYAIVAAAWLLGASEVWRLVPERADDIVAAMPPGHPEAATVNRLMEHARVIADRCHLHASP